MMLNEGIRTENKLITANEGTIVSLDEFKEHLRWDKDDNSEDATMTRKLAAAAQDFSDFTGRPLLVETWRLLFDSFCSQVTLPKGPVDVESIEVNYRDEDSVDQVLDADEYEVIDGGDDGLTVIKFTGNTQATDGTAQCVWVDYDAGYENPPAKVIAGVLEMASDYFEYRRSDAKRPVTPSAYRAWFPYKLFYHNQVSV